MSSSNFFSSHKPKILRALFTATLIYPVSSWGFQGPYVGGHAGLAFMDGIHKYTNGAGQEGKTVLKQFGYGAGLQGGYMQYVGDSKGIIGGEITLTMMGLNNNNELIIPGNPVEGKFSIRHRYVLGLGIFGGAVLNPKVMTYVKVSMENNHVMVTYSNLSFQTPSTEKFSLKLRNFVPALGGLFKMTPHMLLGLEYGYSMMPKKTLRRDDTILNGARRGYTFNINEHRLLARFLYIF